jgi:hypothetical protein
LAEGDVLVGDRAFCSFAHLALLAVRNVFGVFRVHQKQIVDFRPHRRAASKQSRKRGEKGLPTSRWLKRLGRHDQLVEYVKPTKRPDWLTAETYAALPDCMTVRELRYTIVTRGCRTRVITIATTLLDPERYPAADIAALYGQRWHIEICQADCTASVSCCQSSRTGYDSSNGVAGIGQMDGATRQESIRRIHMSNNSRTPAPPRADRTRRRLRHRSCAGPVCRLRVGGNCITCSVR